MSSEVPRYRIYLVAPIDKRLGMRLDDAFELGSYQPEDPAWLPAVGETFTFQETNYKIALPAQSNDDPSTQAGVVYVEPAQPDLVCAGILATSANASQRTSPALALLPSPELTALQPEPKIFVQAQPGRFLRRRSTALT